MNLPSLRGCRSSPTAEHRHSQTLLLWICCTSLGTGRPLGCPWVPAGSVGLLGFIWEAHGTESKEQDKNQIKITSLLPWAYTKHSPAAGRSQVRYCFWKSGII